MVMLVHPFYLHLSHMHYIETDEIRREAEAYLDALLAFLSLRSNRSPFGVVALETPHHYAAATSILVEVGLIDQVIFTRYDSGLPLHPEELYLFKDNELFFGGGYNEYCFETAVSAMTARKSSGRIHAIRELVIQSPRSNVASLWYEQVHGVDPRNVVSLEQVVQMLGLLETTDT